MDPIKNKINIVPIHPEFDKVCRACGKIDLHYEMQSVFNFIKFRVQKNERLQIIKIADLFMSCTDTKVELNDELPTAVCWSCVLLLKRCYIFKTQCEISYQTFEDHVLKKKLKTNKEPETENKNQINITNNSSRKRNKQDNKIVITKIIKKNSKNNVHCEKNIKKQTEIINICDTISIASDDMDVEYLDEDIISSNVHVPTNQNQIKFKWIGSNGETKNMYFETQNNKKTETQVIKDNCDNKNSQKIDSQSNKCSLNSNKFNSEKIDNQNILSQKIPDNFDSKTQNSQMCQSNKKINIHTSESNNMTDNINSQFQNSINTSSSQNVINQNSELTKQEIKCNDKIQHNPSGQKTNNHNQTNKSQCIQTADKLKIENLVDKKNRHSGKISSNDNGKIDNKVNQQTESQEIEDKFDDVEKTLEKLFQTRAQTQPSENLNELLKLNASENDLIGNEPYEELIFNEIKHFKCHICFQDFTNCAELTNHIAKHSADKRQYLCEHCTEKYFTPNLLMIHIANVHKNLENYVCVYPKCTKQLKTADGLLNHNDYHIIGYHEKTKCSICDKMFLDEAECKLHKESHVGNGFQCNMCAKIFLTENNLKIHRARHEQNFAHLCSNCGKQFLSKGELESHIKSHIQEKEVQCEVCQKQFKCKSSLKNHYKIHVDEKPYLCQKCGQRFNHNGNLESHLQRHEGVKNFDCLICNRKLHSNYELKTHLRKHTGESPYTCNICDKKFRSNNGLRNHMGIHLMDKCIKCKKCQVYFTSSNFYAHLKKNCVENKIN